MKIQLNTLLVASLICISTSTIAQSRVDLTRDKASLQIVTQMANDVCKDPSLVGMKRTETGSITGTLQTSSITKRIMGANLVAKGKRVNEIWKGLRQTDMAAALKDRYQCRQNVFNTFIKVLYPTKVSSTQSSTPDQKPIIKLKVENGQSWDRDPDRLGIFVQNLSNITIENVIIEVEAFTSPKMQESLRAEIKNMLGEHLATPVSERHSSERSIFTYNTIVERLSKIHPDFFCFGPVSNKEIEYYFSGGYEEGKPYKFKFNLKRLLPEQLFYFAAVLPNDNWQYDDYVADLPVFDRYVSPSERKRFQNDVGIKSKETQLYNTVAKATVRYRNYVFTDFDDRIIVATASPINRKKQPVINPYLHVSNSLDSNSDAFEVFDKVGFVDGNIWYDMAAEVGKRCFWQS